MAKRTASIYVRTEPQLKKDAERILDELGISASDAINMFYKEIVREKGLPLNLNGIPFEINEDLWIKEREMEELRKAEEDIRNGRVYTLEEVEEKLEKELGIKLKKRHYEKIPHTLHRTRIRGSRTNSKVLQGNRLA